MTRVLVVDDEQPIVDILAYHLEKEGFEVQGAADGLEALRRVEMMPPDLIILDLMLPGLDGIAVCREIRRHLEVPIMILTAKGDETDRVVGLEIGADDYVVKPFSVREVVARARALIRRTTQPRQRTDDQLAVGQLVLDPAAYTLTQGDKVVALTGREFSLLLVLATHAGQVLSRDDLTMAVWGSRSGSARLVDVTIRRLRAKIEGDPSHPVTVKTRRGRGYYLELESH